MSFQITLTAILIGLLVNSPLLCNSATSPLDPLGGPSANNDSSLDLTNIISAITGDSKSVDGLLPDLLSLLGNGDNPAITVTTLIRNLLESLVNLPYEERQNAIEEVIYTLSNPSDSCGTVTKLSDVISSNTLTPEYVLNLIVLVTKFIFCLISGK